MNTLAFLQNLSSTELVLIFLVVLLFFGAKRLPELFKSLGKSVKEFKDATSGIENDIRKAMDPEDAPKPAPKVEAKQVEAAPQAPESEDKKS